MNKRLAFVIITACLMGCAEKTPEHDSTIEVAPASGTVTTTSVTPDSVQTQESAPVTPTTTNVPQPVSQASPATPVMAGMNPPHGQPNHRCDIAVGAPLNSPPTAKSAPKTDAVISKPQMTTTTQQTPKVEPLHDPAMKGKANPAHGEPGHDCAVAVGVILD